MTREGGGRQQERKEGDNKRARREITGEQEGRQQESKGGDGEGMGGERQQESEEGMGVNGEGTNSVRRWRGPEGPLWGAQDGWQGGVVWNGMEWTRLTTDYRNRGSLARDLARHHYHNMSDCEFSDLFSGPMLSELIFLYSS